MQFPACAGGEQPVRCYREGEQREDGERQLPPVVRADGGQAGEQRGGRPDPVV